MTEKTKTQLNWEVGKEQQELFINEFTEKGWGGWDLDLLFKQIRQNEYRRGKEDGLKIGRDEMRKEFDKLLDNKTYGLTWVGELKQKLRELQSKGDKK